MSTKLTPWFPGDVKPARPGVYQTRDGKDVCYQFWTGEQWNMATTSAEYAADFQQDGDRSHFQNDPWRGLAEKP